MLNNSAEFSPKGRRPPQFLGDDTHGKPPVTWSEQGQTALQEHNSYDAQTD